MSSMTANGGKKKPLKLRHIGLTQLLRYVHGQESIKRTGCWSSQSQINTEGLIFGIDASGGVGSKNPRTSVVSWAVVAGIRTTRGIEMVGAHCWGLETLANFVVRFGKVLGSEA